MGERQTTELCKQTTKLRKCPTPSMDSEKPRPASSWKETNKTSSKLQWLNNFIVAVQLSPWELPVLNTILPALKDPNRKNSQKSPKTRRRQSSNKFFSNCVLFFLNLWFRHLCQLYWTSGSPRNERCQWCCTDCARGIEGVLGPRRLMHRLC